MEKITRKEQSAATKKKIVQSVQKLLNILEPEKIKIRDICKDAGVSAGTFYVYFSSKEEAILYIYRDCDQAFENLELSQDGKENIFIILRTYFQMVKLDNMSFTRHLYICHLTYYDAYFFDENRSLYQVFEKQLCLFAKRNVSREIVWKSLDYMRGCIYNLCTRFEIDTKNWVETQITNSWQYICFLLESEA